ncbi:hypothetical protein DFH07DRAFT_572472 [Mycena maculata]|uniref:Secreted protein n=1 Tax=Mycena maculata TaxID=230809 RepID=A0AAD7IRU0_9AGAR|nr:hypothetical protein DFH07DRAFT_572472 [Mycena maculata]
MQTACLAALMGPVPVCSFPAAACLTSSRLTDSVFCRVCSYTTSSWSEVLQDFEFVWTGSRLIRSAWRRIGYVLTIDLRLPI